MSKTKMCICVRLYVYAYLPVCMCQCMYFQKCFFHIPTYDAQFCVRASADVIVLLIALFIYLQGVEKVRWGLNEYSVGAYLG